jgi:hypothetical protein
MSQYGSTLTEGAHKAECLISEAAGSRSREQAVLSSGQVVVDGQVLTLSGGEYIAAEGDETASTLAVALGNYDATDGDVDIVILKRDCEVRESALSVTGSEGNLTAVIVALATLGIIAR